MPPQLIAAISLIIIAMAVCGLITGKVMAGSRGFRANYYTRRESPFLYSAFIGIYFFLGLFLLANSLSGR